MHEMLVMNARQRDASTSGTTLVRSPSSSGTVAAVAASAATGLIAAPAHVIKRAKGIWHRLLSESPLIQGSGQNKNKRTRGGHVSWSHLEIEPAFDVHFLRGCDFPDSGLLHAVISKTYLVPKGVGVSYSVFMFCTIHSLSMMFVTPKQWNGYMNWMLGAERSALNVQIKHVNHYTLIPFSLHMFPNS